MSCDRCDGPGGVLTYLNQACMPLGGKVQGIDWCISQIVASLNAGGVETVASCCGHGEQVGSIVLADGRELLIWNPKKNDRRCMGSSVNIANAVKKALLETSE